MRRILHLFFSLFLLGGLTAQSNVTLNVDMSNYAGTFETLYVSGTFNNWDGVANPLADDDMDGIYTTTISVPDGPIEFKYQVDGWFAQEALAPELTCTLTTGDFTNRFLEVAGDTTLDPVCWNSCDACVAAVDGMVTLTVDMSTYAGTFTTVYLSGGFNSWSGDGNPMTDNTDGTWTTTVMMPAGTNEYKFTTDNWNDQEMLMEGMPCTSTIDGFTNRSLSVNGDATVDAVCWNACDACGAAVDGMVTLTVDMSTYASTFTTVYLSGGFNSWSGDGNPMTDNTDGTWTTTVMMPAGTNEYKFTTDNWNDQEMLMEGMPCTSTIDGFTNRSLSVNGDATVDAVCWNECSGCGAAVPGMITLNVDMSEYSGTFTTVFVSGLFNGWAGADNPMEDTDGDGVWTTTVEMGAGANEYKFQVDEWNDQEMLEIGSACTLTTGEFTNRIIEVNGDATIPATCWASCEECGAVGPQDSNITISVDMNDYTGTFTNVYISGVFNNWSGDANLMDDSDGDGVYTITVSLAAGVQEYKFSVDNWTDSESLTEGDACTLTTEGFTNRVIEVTVDATIDVVCWGLCTTCTINTFDLVDSDLIFQLQPTLVQDFTVITFNTEINQARQLDITDALGRTVYTNKVENTTEQLEINTSNWSNGTYFVRVLVGNKLAIRRMVIAK